MRRCRITIQRRRDPAVQRAGALRAAVRRWLRICVRSSERSHPGLHEGREIREGENDRHQDARRWIDLGYRVLARPAAEIHVCSRRQERAHLHSRSRVARSAVELRRRRADNRASSSACTALRPTRRGNIFTTETYEGRRVQKFVFKGVQKVPRDQGVVWPK